MPFIGKTPETGAFRLIDSITTSATDTYALTVLGDHYFPESARNLIVSLNGVTQAPETAYTVSGSHIVFASALTSSDVIDYILVIGDAVDIGTPSDGTVGNAQLKANLDLSGKTLTFSNDQISGDVIHGGTISNFASTGIDDNATSTAITIGSGQNVGIGVTNAVAPLHAKGTTDGNLLVRGGSSAASGLTGTALSSVNDAVNATTPLTLEGSEFNFVQSNAVKMRLDSSGKVGIGTTTLINPLTVNLTPNTNSKTSGSAFDGGAIRLTSSGGLSTTNSEMAILAGAEDSLSAGIGFARENAADWGTQIRFYTHDTAITTTDELTERMRLDASGNLLVNTTNKLTSAELSAGETGIALRSGDLLIVSREAGAGVLVNRKTSDGDLIEFRKDGTTVGGIKSISGVVSGIVFDPRNVNSGGAGIGGTNGSSVAPMDRNGFSDADIDLGLSSIRWRDIYLSGGAYLGGTGAVNHLDHYEEGTWTPTLVADSGTKTWTYNAQVGYFTRIGRQVTVWFNIQLSSNGSGTDGNARITGLPFNSGNLTNLVGNYAVFWKQLIETADVALMGRNPNSQSYIDLIDGSSSYPDIAFINTSVLTFDRRIRGTLTYQV